MGTCTGGTLKVGCEIEIKDVLCVLYQTHTYTQNKNVLELSRETEQTE